MADRRELESPTCFARLSAFQAETVTLPTTRSMMAADQGL